VITTILNGLLPVVFVVGLGWLSGRLKLLKHDDAGVLANYVVRFALPLALFEGARSTSPEQLLNYGLLIALTIGLLGTFIIALLIGRFVFGHDLKTASLQGLVCSFPDMAYFAAPVLAALYGPAGFLAILLGNLVVMILILPATIILTHASDAGAHDKRGGMGVVVASVAGAVKNPIVWLPLLGVVLSVSRFTLPQPVGISIETVARSAGGTSLLALGLMLFGEPVRFNVDVGTNVALKQVLQPLLIFAGALLVGLSPTVSQQAILTGSAPSATAASMFALKSAAYTAEATSTVFFSTVLAIVIDAILIALFQAPG
jgi:malonate transporter and related proteins